MKNSKLAELFYNERMKFHRYIYDFHMDFDDTIQHCCLMILENRDEYEFPNESRMYGFLWTVVKNTCINFFRRNKKYERIPMDKMYNLQNEEPFFPDLLEIISKTRLTEHEKTIIYRHYWQGFKYEEISAEFAVPLGTIKSQLFYARKQLEFLKDI